MPTPPFLYGYCCLRFPYKLHVLRIVGNAWFILQAHDLTEWIGKAQVVFVSVDNLEAAEVSLWEMFPINNRHVYAPT